MAESKVELRKLRDFGENFNDTFTFIRQNLKPLLSAFFAICGTFLLIHAIANGVYQSRNFGVLDQFWKIGSTPTTNTPTMPGIFTLEYFLVLLFGVLAFSSIVTTVGAYLKFYDANGGMKPTVEQVWQIFRRYFVRIFLYSIPIILLDILSMIICCFPVFYVATVLAPFPFAVMMEDLDFSSAFNRCFVIIKNNFWISLATYIVAGMIYYFATLIIGAVIGLLAGLGTYFTTRDFGTTMGIVTSVLNIFSSMFSMVLVISIAFNYFNLTEQYDGTGILRKIDNLGSTENNNFDNIDEQY